MYVIFKQCIQYIFSRPQNTPKNKKMTPVNNYNTDCQGFCFSRNIGSVTLKIIHFHYLEKNFSGSKYPVKYISFWKRKLCWLQAASTQPTRGQHGFGTLQLVMPFQPKYCLGHPENYLILLSKKCIYRIKVSKNKLISFWKNLHCLQCCTTRLQQYCAPPLVYLLRVEHATSDWSAVSFFSKLYSLANHTVC